MSFVLREYQHGLIVDVKRAFRSDPRVLLQSPTGSGKTVLTAHMVSEAASRKKRTYFLVHRRELLEQTSRALWASKVPHGLIAGGKTVTQDIVQVATIQTLARRVGKVPAPDLLIIDEAHHAAAASYRNVLDSAPNAYVVGLTATPVRTDGRGLDDLFGELVLGPEVSWLTEQGYLAPYRLIAPPKAIDLSGVHTRGGEYVRSELAEAMDKSTIMGDAVDHYLKYVVPAAKAEGQTPSCLVYCVSRLHARHVEEVYRSAGVDARYCAGDTPTAERRQIIEGFRRGRPPVIVSVDLFGEGLDVPGLYAVQLLRPTQSLSLHLQQIGRALRPEPGKTALILDHVGNTWNHGLPDDPRDWCLEGTKGTGSSSAAAPALRHCANCFAIYPAGKPRCPQCGEAPEVNTDLPEEVDGELQEVDPREHRRIRAMEEAAAEELQDLVALAKKRKYKAAWAGIRFAVRQGHKPGSPEAVGLIRKAQRMWTEAP